MGAKLITPEVGTIIWTVITFVILAALLGRFAWKPMLQMLEQRETSIKDSLDQAQRARDESEETLKKNQEILASARRETAAILDQGRRESEEIRGELLAKAKQESQELVEQGKRQIQHEQKQAVAQLRAQVADLAIRQLRAQVADLAILGAEHLISRSLDDDKHRELVSSYVQSLPALGTEDNPRG
jgi:F-type H+-transporting ATPase subunit b